MEPVSDSPTEDAALSEMRCANCGAYVSHRFARVFGDNEDVVYGCLECSTVRELCRGQGTTPQDVNQEASLPQY